MSNIEIKELQQLKKESKLTYSDIASMAELPLSTVQKVLGGKIKSPRPATLEAIEDALHRSNPVIGDHREISIGNQDFASIIENNYFYIDKTSFIREWWDKGDVVTLITRPRRFGKTLNLSMVNYFFSNKYQDGKKWFENLDIWKNKEYHALLGKYPVIFISFANVKEPDYDGAIRSICSIISELFRGFREIVRNESLLEADIEYFNGIMEECKEEQASGAINRLSRLLFECYGEKVLILLDEYDTPMQEAYVNGYWDKISSFIRNLFNSTFKTNPYMLRGLMSGITRISKESIFSDLNNLRVITTTSETYADKFGFTQEEVDHALEAFGIKEKEEVKKWYDGFHFGNVCEMYNPWSVLSFLDEKRIATYWANTSSNSLVSKLIREGDRGIKSDFECLLNDGIIEKELDEEIVYSNLDSAADGIWSLLLASGYLKATEIIADENGLYYGKYKLRLTNQEVKTMFQKMVSSWFKACGSNYNDLIKALLVKDIKAMNYYMNQVALSTFSFFDTGKNVSGSSPERFYHGFILGLLVDLRDEYIVKSNRESGFGRYDVVIEPKNKSKDAFILEFKVHDADEESTMEDTVIAAKKQIAEKQYSVDLENAGVKKKNIYSYGFAFEGKKVLIG
ncbi:PD-(D/E)XK nuclease superfamily protein [Butyrivibrio proteoclasticus]|uniref:PD-(D/E)XK nuclease superfamily protein n=1 Tax=Butyrivibrio proteoclasticus TaxID=43305 RepID=A0A1I5VWZ7_9FIRM|nr:AAA family ATPase [Butyrivibrio proteoclasticus]SFQ12084.1 PD-(D/E)XK nuclease superfamily protein [Butyrivibrio proteoclasticus]